MSETCGVIWEVLAPIYLCTDPSPEKWENIAERFEKLWNFPNCCDAVDGKDIRIEGPWNCGSAFFNYKNFHSIVLQAVADADGNFLFVDAGEAGRNSDGGVFSASGFGKSLINQELNLPVPTKLEEHSQTMYPYVFLGDDAYALSKHLMKPFARSSNLTKDEKIYNYRHSRARRVVESACGMMSKKFRVLGHPMLVHVNVSIKITLACCALHNMIRKREGKLTDVYDELMNFEVDESDTHVENVRARATKAAYKVRDNFIQYFISAAGSVSWQDKMAFC